MPLEEWQRRYVMKALENYHIMQYWMIRNYADYVNNPDTVENYTIAMCDIFNRMINWVIEYSKKMFNIDVTYDEAEELVRRAITERPVRDHRVEEAFRACLQYRTAHEERLREIVREMVRRKG